MQPLPVSGEIDALLKLANPAVLACSHPDGSPLTCAVWYLWRDGEVLLTFDRERTRLRFIRRNPAVSLTVLDARDWLRNVGLFGRVTELGDDEGLRVADELAQHYMGRPYPDRNRPRVYGRMTVDGWFGWNAYARVTNLQSGSDAAQVPSAHE